LTEPGKSIFTAIKMHVDLFYLNSHPEAMYTNFIYADLSNLTSGNSSKLKFEVGTVQKRRFGKDDTHKEMKIWINKAVVSGFKKLCHPYLRIMHENSSGNYRKYVKSEDWKSTFQRASSELVRYMAKELHAIELNAPGLSAAVEDPFQVDKVMTGDEGIVTLCITRGNNKTIYVQNVLIQHAMAMVDGTKASTIIVRCTRSRRKFVRGSKRHLTMRCVWHASPSKAASSSSTSGTLASKPAKNRI
jgi:hypothetical protein